MLQESSRKSRKRHSGESAERHKRSRIMPCSFSWSTGASSRIEEGWSLRIAQEQTMPDDAYGYVPTARDYDVTPSSSSESRSEREARESRESLREQAREVREAQRDREDRAAIEAERKRNSLW